jgi:hypothetical protein
MRYGIEFTPRADDDFNALPPVVASKVLDELDELAKDPAARSRPSHFPHLPGRQLFQSRIETEGDVWWITILFRYAQDEQNLVILDIVATT